MFLELEPIAIEAGVNVLEYWTLTLAEIRVVIISFNNRLERERRNQAQATYELGTLIKVAIISSLDKKTKFPSINQVYSNLFQENTNKQQDWRVFKANVEKYTSMKNKI